MMAKYVPVLFDDMVTAMNPWFENLMGHFGTSAMNVKAASAPSARMDFYRKDGKLFVEAEMPGFNPEDVDLHVYGDRMTLSAEKNIEAKEGEDRNYLRTERSWGKVERVLYFPVEADPDTAKASFKNGVLTIEVAEKSEDKAHRKVEISCAA